MLVLIKKAIQLEVFKFTLHIYNVILTLVLHAPAQLVATVNIAIN